MAKDRTLQTIQSAVESGTLKAGASQLLGSYEPLAGPLPSVAPPNAVQLLLLKIDGAKNGRVKITPMNRVDEGIVWMLFGADPVQNFFLPAEYENTEIALESAIYDFQQAGEGESLAVGLAVYVDDEDAGSIMPDGVSVHFVNKLEDLDGKDFIGNTTRIQLAETDIIVKLDEERYRLEYIGLYGGALGLEENLILSRELTYRMPFAIPAWDGTPWVISVKTI